MAVFCAQCGTENPDGNAFCMSCGSALTASSTAASDEVTQTIQTGPFPAAGASPVAPTAAAGPGPFSSPTPPVAVAPGTALPPLTFMSAESAPPGGYLPPSGPYLPAPPSGTPPAHRTSTTMLIAIVVAVLVIVAGGGVAYAALNKGGTTPGPSPNIPVTVPTTAPTSAPTAAPTQAPVSTPAPVSPGGGGQTVSAAFAKIFVPTGFTVADQESDSIVLVPSNGNEEAVGAQAQPLTGATTNAQLDQDLLEDDQESDDPSAKMCSTKAPSQTQLVGSGGSITADVISICENLTPPNGPAFAAVDGYFAGVAKAADGSFKAVWFEFLAPASSFQAFTASIPSALISQSVFSDASPPA